MTARLLLLLCSLLLALPAQAQRRTIMEGLAAGANTIYVDTANVKVSIATTTIPSTSTFHVLGAASFTSTVTAALFSGSFSGNGTNITGLTVNSVSSYTYVPVITGTAAIAYYVGYATVSITADGINPVEISWNGTYENVGNSVSASFTQDNAWYTGFSASIGLTENTSTPPKSIKFVLNNPIPSAGVHKYIFMLNPNGAGAASSCRTDIVCQWGARVVH